jgi:hypothetical protein
MPDYVVEISGRPHRVGAITLEKAIIQQLQAMSEDYRKPGYKPRKLMKIKCWAVPEGR